MNRYQNLYVRPETHHRLSVYSAVNRLKLVDVADQAITRFIDSDDSQERNNSNDKPIDSHE